MNTEALGVLGFFHDQLIKISLILKDRVTISVNTLCLCACVCVTEKQALILEMSVCPPTQVSEVLFEYIFDQKSAYIYKYSGKHPACKLMDL